MSDGGNFSGAVDGNRKDLAVCHSVDGIFDKLKNPMALQNTRYRGADILRHPKINKGCAFTLSERQMLGIHGLLPPSIVTQEDQLQIVLQNLQRYEQPLDQYIYLIGLQERNEKLFYRAVIENIELIMPIIYTPTVGHACETYGLIHRRPKGLFITIHDKGHIYDILCNWPESNVKAIVVTDGERILGLGDLGAYGMGIPVGKLSLYTACAGVKPHLCLPITLDVGTNNEKLLSHPLYIGLRHRRIQGHEYDAFIDEFMQAVIQRFGQTTLVQFEDFGNHNAFRLLKKYRQRYCTFNDDIQGTASVTLAGLLAAMQVTGGMLSKQTIMFQGAGEAAIGIASLIVMAMESEGTNFKDALDRIWMVDSRGLIVLNRPSGGLNEQKMTFARNHPPMDNLEAAVAAARPSIIIGCAAVQGAFNEKILNLMGQFNQRPIIIALSNPTSKAECTAEQAYTATLGLGIFASGSPFNPVTIHGKTLFPGQGNNAYIFPGVALGVIACGIYHIEDIIFLKAAQILASCVTKEDLAEGRIYPPLNKIRSVSIEIAKHITEYAYEKKIASHYPEPMDKLAFVQSHLYCTEYESIIPSFYDWPDQ